MALLHSSSEKLGKSLREEAKPASDTAPIPFFRLELSEEEISSVVDVLRSGWLTSGTMARKFEEEFAESLGGDVEAVAVNSNTVGMHLALEAAGIGPGDEVILPTLTFTATAEVVRYLGATPVFADIDPDTICIDPDHVERLITEKTRMIMPVHFAGRSCDMDSLQNLARAHDLQIVEDAAHAFPATHGGQKIGTFGTTAAVFSFYANKTITTGEGGMVVTNDKKIADRCRLMRLHGIDRDVFDRFTSNKASWQYDVVAPGFKYNLTDIAAALGREQLKRAEEMRVRREEIANRYTHGLKGLPLVLPEPLQAGDVHSWHLYIIQLAEGGAIDRAGLEKAFKKADVGYSVHYTPLHRLTYWRDTFGLSDDAFPNATRYFERCLSLPLFPAMRDDEVDRVIETVRSAFSS